MPDPPLGIKTAPPMVLCLAVLANHDADVPEVLQTRSWQVGQVHISVTPPGYRDGCYLVLGPFDPVVSINGRSFDPNNYRSGEFDLVEFERCLAEAKVYAETMKDWIAARTTEQIALARIEPKQSTITRALRRFRT